MARRKENGIVELLAECNALADQFREIQGTCRRLLDTTVFITETIPPLFLVRAVLVHRFIPNALRLLRVTRH